MQSGRSGPGIRSRSLLTLTRVDAISSSITIKRPTNCLCYVIPIDKERSKIIRIQYPFIW